MHHIYLFYLSLAWYSASDFLVLVDAEYSILRTIPSLDRICGRWAAAYEVGGGLKTREGSISVLIL